LTASEILKPAGMKKLFIVVLLLALVHPIRAQVIDVKGKVKDKSVERADQKVDEGIDEGLDAVEEGVVGLFKKKDTAKDEEESSDEEQASEKSRGKMAESTDDETNQSGRKQSITSYSKFDFIAGETIIFFDDFSKDPVGEFPAKWNTNNNAEVVTVGGHSGKWFKLPADGGNYIPELKGTFPDNVTIEFDVLMTDKNTLGATYYSEAQFDVDAYGVPGEAGAEMDINTDELEYHSYNENDNGINTTSSKALVEVGTPTHISIWIQKSRFRMYINEAKVFDIPKGVFSEFKYNRFRFNTYNTQSDVFVTNVRIAVGAPDTRNQLITEGRLVTRGILFDTNSDKIKPESYGCIKEIATVLKENPSVNVMIVGHTDSDGDNTSNLDLSKRRAAAVKSFLSKEFGIDSSRMQTDGKGESQPADNNNTPEGKAQNRRVEFIKL